MDAGCTLLLDDDVMLSPAQNLLIWQVGGCRASLIAFLGRHSPVSHSLTREDGVAVPPGEVTPVSDTVSMMSCT